MMPHINIVILNWNGKEVLEACLDSVSRIDYPNFSTTVIDNGSTDGSLEKAEEKHENIESIRLDKNYGFAGGYNKYFQTLEDKQNQFLLLLNNDTEVEPDILTCFVQATKKFGAHHIYGGKIFYQKKPQLIWYAGGRAQLKYARISHRGIRSYDHDKFQTPITTDYVTGCCLFTSINVIKKLSGFDEQFHMYGEDVDLCLRGKKIGINCYYWPKAQLRHHISASLGGAFSLRKLTKKTRGILHLLKKYHFDKRYPR